MVDCLRITCGIYFFAMVNFFLLPMFAIMIESIIWPPFACPTLPCNESVTINCNDSIVGHRIYINSEGQYIGHYHCQYGNETKMYLSKDLDIKWKQIFVNSFAVYGIIVTIEAIILLIIYIKYRLEHRNEGYDSIQKIYV